MARALESRGGFGPVQALAEGLHPPTPLTLPFRTLPLRSQVADAKCRARGVSWPKAGICEQSLRGSQARRVDPPAGMPPSGIPQDRAPCSARVAALPRDRIPSPTMRPWAPLPRQPAAPRPRTLERPPQNGIGSGSRRSRNHSSASPAPSIASDSAPRSSPSSSSARSSAVGSKGPTMP